MNTTVRYIGFDPEFNGSLGHAFEASGFWDPESAEFRAYLFQPEGHEIALYCSGEDLAAA